MFTKDDDNAHLGAHDHAHHGLLDEGSGAANVGTRGDQQLSVIRTCKNNIIIIIKMCFSSSAFGISEGRDVTKMLSSDLMLSNDKYVVTALTVCSVPLCRGPGVRAVHVAVLGAGELVTQDAHDHLLPQHGARQPSQPEVDVVLDDLRRGKHV